MRRILRRAARLTVEGLEQRCVPAILGLDFGDLPSPYPVTFAENGARHDAIGPFLGSARDQELNGQHSPLADADADDDGITFFGPFVQGQPVFLDIQAPQGGLLDAWVDFNADGDFADDNEQIFNSEELASEGEGNFRLFYVPQSAVEGPTFARFRLSSSGELSFDGPASTGEVEDYAVAIEPAIIATGADPGDDLVQVNVGETFTLDVGSFVPTIGFEQAEFTAQIDWGDGTVTPGVVEFEQKGWFVSGTHTYQEESTFLVRFTVTETFSGATASADSGAVIALLTNQDAVLDDSDFDFIGVGGGSVDAEAENIFALLEQPTGSTNSATLFVARYNDDPFDADQFFDKRDQKPLVSHDVRVTGGDVGGQVTVTFTVPGATRAPVLFFYDSETQSYRRVKGSDTVTNSLDFDPDTGTLKLVLDASSFPKIGDLTGTVFTITLPSAAPTTSTAAPTTFATTTTSLTPTTAQAAVRTSSSDRSDSSSSNTTTVTFRTSSKLGLSFNAAQDSARAARAASGSGSTEDKKDEDDKDKPRDPKKADQPKDKSKPKETKMSEGKSRTSERVDPEPPTVGGAEEGTEQQQERTPEPEPEARHQPESATQGVDAYFAWTAGAVGLLGWRGRRRRADRVRARCLAALRS